MSLPTCQRKGFAHYNRCRYTHGFACEDCGQFFSKDSPTYLRYELPSDLQMVIHNLRADRINADEKGKPFKVSAIRYEKWPILDALVDLDKEDDDAKREAVLNEALRIIAANGKTRDSATLGLTP